MSIEDGPRRIQVQLIAADALAAYITDELLSGEPASVSRLDVLDALATLGYELTTGGPGGNAATVAYQQAISEGS